MTRTHFLFLYNYCPIVLAICNGSPPPINRQKEKSTNKPNPISNRRLISLMSHIGYDTVQNDFFLRVQYKMIIYQGELVVYNPPFLSMGIFINFISFHEIK